MIARLKATGDTFNVIGMGDDGSFKLEDGNWYSSEEFEFVEGFDYNQVRIQAAIAAMQAFIGVPQMPFEHITGEAVKIADALVAELKKGGEL